MTPFCRLDRPPRVMAKMQQHSRYSLKAFVCTRVADTFITIVENLVNAIDQQFGSIILWQPAVVIHMVASTVLQLSNSGCHQADCLS